MIELFYLKIRIYDWLIEKATSRRKWWDKKVESLSEARNANFKLDMDNEEDFTTIGSSHEKRS